MTLVPRRPSWALAVCCLSIVGWSFASRATASDGKSGSTSLNGCEALRAWARPYEGTSPTLAEVAQFDRGHRLAIFNAVAPAVRAALWREQLARFASWPNLTPAQRALIDEAVTLATPQLYQGVPGAQQALREFRVRAEPAFTSRDHRRAWFDLGSVMILDRRRTDSAWNRLTTRLGPGLQVDYCECNKDDPYDDCGFAFCRSGACTVWLGCGFLGDLWCNGMCDW